ncbi:MAG TPA: type II toxin-antitoxin system PemK/MazF family toxin [Roseiarcus sp.]|nr:type II toxin-antitoxin system PemK/MazF family toxin [Roseiarcus sp.]
MQRGDLVTVALRGDAGKPRPALVVQAEDLFGALPTIVVLPLTSALADLPLTRVTMAPSEASGLRVPSQVMVSRPQSALREQVGPVGSGWRSGPRRPSGPVTLPSGRPSGLVRRPGGPSTWPAP